MEEIPMTYHTKGTCSSSIDFEVEDGIVKSVQFTGGGTLRCRLAM